MGSWPEAMGHQSQGWHVFLCPLIQVSIGFLQRDERWSYLRNKKNQLWVFISLEAPAKFWLSFE